ncbi:halocyanin domain-containing protein [Halospeciosus flavus]|uniref:Halocyanin domain-containing protein n=1 Tax=Halospeciosus flavus TaxID=3032283 RepID=A0ABD5Z511_9EURY|nr:halocyanin domain-containing protein [Halospeciosus flavus]
MSRDRRSFLRTSALVATGGVATLAGCSSDATDSPPTLPSEPDYGGWFDGVENDEGTRDYTGQGEVTVEVGVPAGDGTDFAFGPPAIAVSPVTTVRWEWTGEGGSHDVVAADGSFRSPWHHEAGATFSHQFEETGLVRYYCEAHRELGMRGAVYVTRQ